MIDSLPPDAPPPSDNNKQGFWSRLGGGSLGISIIVHAIILALGVVWIVQSIPPPPPKIVGFTPNGGGGGSTATQSISKQKQRTAMVRNNLARVAAKDVMSDFTLPDPEVSQDISLLSSLGSGALSGGLGGSGSGGGRGTGQGSGFGAGSGIGIAGGTGAGNLFGMIGSAGTGMLGTFYDFKRNKSGHTDDVPTVNPQMYAEIIREFTNSKNWKAPRKYPHFTSPTQLRAKAFFFPGMPDTDAGKAFNSPEAQPGMWVAHYKGTVKAKETGHYRLIGWGDNCLIVGINGKVRLDASDKNYIGGNRESAGSANVRGKGGASVFYGDWFQVKAGQSFSLDVLIGDEGGIFAAAAMLERKGDDFKPVQGNMPNLPILRVSDLSAAELQLYDGELPPNALKGPVFEVDSAAVPADF